MLILVLVGLVLVLVLACPVLINITGHVSLDMVLPGVCLTVTVLEDCGYS